MNKALITCFVAAGLCGSAHAATWQQQQQTLQPITVTASGGMSYELAKLENEIQMLQTEVRTLGTLEGQAAGDSHYVFSAGPEGSPVSTGG